MPWLVLWKVWRSNIQLVSDFSSGGITWGEFNRRRSEMNKRMREGLKMALNSQRNSLLYM
jgi:hypothetical protein